jgi:uncharacterized membrane protein YhaH (DUF805 family)
MIDYFKMAFEKYADFQTRSSRSEFWYFFLANIIIIFGLMMIGIIMSEIFNSSDIKSAAAVILVIYYIAAFIPNFSIAVRRLHDTNRSGWFLLMGLIPFIGSIIMLVFFSQESDLHANKWGHVPDPDEFYELDDVSYELKEELIDFDKDIV